MCFEIKGLRTLFLGRTCKLDHLSPRCCHTHRRCCLLVPGCRRLDVPCLRTFTSHAPQKLLLRCRAVWVSQNSKETREDRVLFPLVSHLCPRTPGSKHSCLPAKLEIDRCGTASRSRTELRSCGSNI